MPIIRYTTAILLLFILVSVQAEQKPPSGTWLDHAAMSPTKLPAKGDIPNLLFDFEYIDNSVPKAFTVDMNDDGTLTLITHADRCRGLSEKDPWRIGDWLLDQGIVPYDEMNALFSGITIPLQSQKIDIDNPQIKKMLFMALYNIDKFRDFVFNSTFLNRFDVEPIRIEKIKRSDEELLKFAFDWIKFGLFGEKLFWVKDDAPGKED